MAPRLIALDPGTTDDDCRLVQFGHFAGDGSLLGHELTDDPAVVKLCGMVKWRRAADTGLPGAPVGSGSLDFPSQ